MSVWYCCSCEKSLNHMGVPRHRKMHRDRGDTVLVMESEKYRYTYTLNGVKEQECQG